MDPILPTTNPIISYATTFTTNTVTTHVTVPVTSLTTSSNIDSVTSTLTLPTMKSVTVLPTTNLVSAFTTKPVTTISTSSSTDSLTAIVASITVNPDATLPTVPTTVVTTIPVITKTVTSLHTTSSSVNPRTVIVPSITVKPDTTLPTVPISIPTTNPVTTESVTSLTTLLNINPLTTIIGPITAKPDTTPSKVPVAGIVTTSSTSNSTDITVATTKPVTTKPITTLTTSSNINPLTSIIPLTTAKPDSTLLTEPISAVTTNPVTTYVFEPVTTLTTSSSINPLTATIPSITVKTNTTLPTVFTTVATINSVTTEPLTSLTTLSNINPLTAVVASITAKPDTPFSTVPVIVATTNPVTTFATEPVTTSLNINPLSTIIDAKHCTTLPTVPFANIVTTSPTVNSANITFSTTSPVTTTTLATSSNINPLTTIVASKTVKSDTTLPTVPIASIVTTLSTANSTDINVATTNFVTTIKSVTTIATSSNINPLTTIVALTTMKPDNTLSTVPNASIITTSTVNSANIVATTIPITTYPFKPVTTLATLSSINTLTATIASITVKPDTTLPTLPNARNVTTSSTVNSTNITTNTTNPVTSFTTEILTAITVSPLVGLPVTKSRSDTIATEPVPVLITSSTMNPAASCVASPMKFVTALTTRCPVTTLATSSTTNPITTFTTTPVAIHAATISTMRIEPSLHNELNDSFRKKLDSAINKIMEKNSDYFQAKEDNHIDVESIDNEDEDLDEESTDHCIMQQTPEHSHAPFKSEPIHDSTSDVDETHDANLMSTEMTYDFSKLPWSVVISKQASDFLKNKKISRKVIKDTKRILHEIGQGYRTHANCHRCIQHEDNLFEACLYKGARIIWQENIQYSEELSAQQGREIYTDVVRVLWITTRHTKHQLNDVLQKMKTALRKSRCNPTNLVEYKCKQIKTTTLKMPRKFVPADQRPGSKELVECHPLPNIFGGEYSLMQFHPFSDFLDALLNNDQSDFDTAICMSPQEHDIIRLPYRKEPIILCGRSGTGKTTTCIYRMWNEFKTFWEFKETDDLQCEDPELNNSLGRNLHQVFITKSPVLCSQVKKHFENLINGNCNLRKMFNKMELSSQMSIQEFSDHNYPLFLTSRHFLFLLDHSLPGKPFFDRDEAGNVIVKLINSDYNHDINPDILFEDIEEEREVDVIFQKEWKEVTADFFCLNIWPYMRTKVQFEDPLLVWMEIQSFIKGSFEALHTSDGFLQEENYVTCFGKKMAPNYLEEDRRNVYKCFLEYNNILNQSKQCESHRLFDECDVIHNLYHRLQSLLKHQKETGQEMMWYIDNFYVDEIQDFTQAELTLLIMCSKMPNGMFCTGDIAQSIMKGVFFRFEDLRSQFWRLAQAPQHDGLVSVPQLRMLTDNFRTHSGILKLAQSVISVMKSTFKTTFQDSLLPSEVAMFEGPKPILLDLYSDKDLALILLGNKEDGSVQSMELGAHQAIIVRNEEKKHKLPDSLKNGIVLTTLEAKGLEFNDVLLYDFFNDSEVS